MEVPKMYRKVPSTLHPISFSGIETKKLMLLHPQRLFKFPDFYMHICVCLCVCSSMQFYICTDSCIYVHPMYRFTVTIKIHNCFITLRPHYTCLYLHSSPFPIINQWQSLICSSYLQLCYFNII